jgi:dimethylaniline monooxygenase (N-oxide forming)
VYLSHRRSQNIIARWSALGVPFDSVKAWSMVRFLHWLEYVFEPLYIWIFGKYFKKSMKDIWGDFDPAWGLSDPPPMIQFSRIMCINDDIVHRFRDKVIVPVPGVDRVTGPRSIRFKDGTTLDDVDAIIACTGYQQKWNHIEGVTVTELPADLPPDSKRQPDLYMTMFPPEFADSLACMNWNYIPDSPLMIRELVAMAITQVWKGTSPIPTVDEMKAEVKRTQERFLRKTAKYGPNYEKWVCTHDVVKWIHKTAGTGMYENTGWSLKAWWFWLTDRRLYNLIAWGRYNPHSYRLMETGKRKTWAGAREQIFRLNELYANEFGKHKAMPKAKVVKDD